MDALILTRLNEITKTLTDLKYEYSAIRKEIFGIEISGKTNVPGMQLLEKKTLREMIEETQFEVKQINAKILDNERKKEITKETKPMDETIANEAEETKLSEDYPVVEIQEKTNNNKKLKDITEKFKSKIGEKSIERKDNESPKVFRNVEIQRKPSHEERNWVKEEMNKLKRRATIEEGENLWGATVETISSDVRFPDKPTASCTINLSNFLDSDLMHPTEYDFWGGSRTSGLSGASRVVSLREDLLDEITKTLTELKSEYSIIRNSLILGIRVSDSTNSQGMELLANKTLRQIVENTEFQNGVKQNERKDEKSPEEFPVVEIQRKTIDEERNWMKEKFKKIKRTAKIEDGESLRGTTVDAVSSSISLEDKVNASCAIQLSNFLDSDLTDSQHLFWGSYRNSGPSRVNGHRSEIITFVGGMGCCSFLCSFEISRILRLIIRCYRDYNGYIVFGIGFTPADVHTDHTLHDRLWAMPEVPDFWMIKEYSRSPQELFVSHGNYLVRGRMSPGQRSIVHVEILEINYENIPKALTNRIKKTIVDGKSIKSHTSFQNSETISRVPENYGRFSCNIEIINCLNVTLRNPGMLYCKCEKNDFIPVEVLPFQREKFFGANEANMEAMFSYKIDSTDYAIVVALKVQPNENSFAAAFVQINALTVSRVREFEALMDPKQWRTHDYSKYANAKEGVQLIQMGNIRADMQMTEEEQSLLKIRIFAI